MIAMMSFIRRPLPPCAAQFTHHVAFKNRAAPAGPLKMAVSQWVACAQPRTAYVLGGA
jgi:hypothetical protein